MTPPSENRAQVRPLVGPISPRSDSRCRFEPLEIGYRAGDYSTFLSDLVERVRGETVAEGWDAGARPLAKLDLEAHHEWTIGLFKAWAEVGDILSFYQERIANEGFLATAREVRSLREIVRLIDYIPAPGVGSVSKLAYRLRPLPSTPETVLIPERAGVLSVPERKELPQAWETTTQLLAGAEWNALEPRMAAIELGSSLPPSATELDFEGANLGLEAGSPLLLEVSAGAGVAPILRRAAEVEEIARDDVAEPPVTRVTLDRPVQPGPLLGEAPVPGLDVHGAFSFEQELALFGRDAPEWAELDESVKLEYAAPLGGVVVGAPGDGWRSINAGLPEGVVAAVVAGPDGSLYAGTESGVYRTVDGENWRRSGTDLIGTEILTLATDGRQQIFAGTAKNGVLRTTDGETWEVLLGEAIREPLVSLGRGRLPRSGRLPQSPVRVVLPAGDRLFAGTDHGVFVFVQQSDTWMAVNRGLPDWAAKTGRAGVVVQALIRGGASREFFVGTDKGVFRTTANGAAWDGRNAGLPGFDGESGVAEVSVLSLHLNQDRRTGASILMAGTDQGVFRSLDSGASWEPASLGLPGTDVDTGLCETPVAALEFAANPQTLESSYFAATGEGLYVSQNAGVFWTLAPGEVAQREIRALAASSRGGLIAAVPVGGFDRDRWPRFRIRNGEIDLVDAAPGIDAGDWLVLEDGGGGRDRKPIVEMVRAVKVRQQPRGDFTVEGSVTRVLPDRPLEHETEFDLRTTRVLAGARPLRIPTGRRTVLEPLASEVIELDPGQPLRPFSGAREVIVDGKPLRVRFDGARSLETDEGRILAIGEEEEPQVLRAAGGGGSARLRLRLRSGFEGTLTLPRDEITWRPARKEDAAVAESATAEWVEPAPGSSAPSLTLHPRLRRCYDPTTVRILANVVEATQGRTIYRDVLGSGNAASSHQRFEISAPPLAYLRTASAKGWTSTLEVRVNGIRWKEVESLYDAEPQDRVYMVRENIEGVATVIFGDGVHGARLPSGSDNVVALYRSGFWPEGVNRGRLTLPETKPLGLDGVTNPLSAAAGARPEDPERVRARAPIALRTLGRIVSLTDYEDFCRAYPGVSRARVAELATASGNVVQVTVATEAGDELRPGDELHEALIATVNAARAARMPLSILSARRVLFDLRVLVRFEVERRADDVEARVREQLFAAYGYERACFEDRITASDIVRRIGDVPGVVSARLERFHRSALAASAEAFLRARPARWDAAAMKTVPAELLELRSPGGLTLEMVASR